MNARRTNFELTSTVRRLVEAREGVTLFNVRVFDPAARQRLAVALEQHLTAMQRVRACLLSIQNPP